MSQVATSQSEQDSASTRGSRARFLASAVVLLGVLGAGLLGGWVAASQKTTSAAGGHGHGGEGEAGHGAAAPGGKLSARALANLGVEVGEITLSDFVRTVDVPALIEPLPLADRPVSTPAAGVVRAVHVAPGRVVAPGTVLAEVVRDALPQPALSLTEAIIEPLNEAHHEAAVGVRTAALALALATAERSRLAPGEPAGSERLAGRVLREAEYAEQRARLELHNARHEAERHGMTDEQIALLERGDGDVEVPDVPDVRRVLARNRLWTPEADAVLALLPEHARTVPYTLAVLGELVGAGRLTPELVATLRASPALAERFLDVAGLVQQGTTPAGLAELQAQGGLDPIVLVRAPAGGPPDWDVLEVVARTGQRLEAGATVTRLRDDRVMVLRLSPAPSDQGPLARALTDHVPLAAEPLMRGTGEGLTARLVGLTGAASGESAGAVAHADNRALADEDVPGLGRVRTWALRAGLAFVVRVPLQTAKGRFVLPADAIAYQGPEAVVLLQDGDAFKPVRVRLEHHDAEVAVVAADGAVFAGDRVVVHGAPALAMALLAAAGGGIDPHAGHSH